MIIFLLVLSQVSELFCEGLQCSFSRSTITLEASLLKLNVSVVVGSGDNG